MSHTDRDDDRYDRGAFDPVMIDDEDTYDATGEDESGGGRGWIMLLVVLVVAAALGGVVYFAYQQGREEGIRTAPPIVRAEDGPEKVAPQDPGGMEIPHQDKEIFERITGESGSEGSDNGGVERLLPPPEEPVATPQATEPEETPVRSAAETSPPPVTMPEESEPEASQPASTPAPAPQPEPATPAPSAQTASGDWVVQVGSFRSQDQARAQWANLQGKHADTLGDRLADIQEADLGDRGIWYRLRAAGYGSKEAAGQACASLKAGGTDCLVRKR